MYIVVNPLQENNYQTANAKNCKAFEAVIIDVFFRDK